MKTYDLYLFSPGREVISGWHSFEAAQDEGALEIADGLVKQPPAELWRDSVLAKCWERQP